MKFPTTCYFCGKQIEKYVWAETTSPSGFNIIVASCPACKKARDKE